MHIHRDHTYLYHADHSSVRNIIHMACIRLYSHTSLTFMLFHIYSRPYHQYIIYIVITIIYFTNLIIPLHNTYTNLDSYLPRILRISDQLTHHTTNLTPSTNILIFIPIPIKPLHRYNTSLSPRKPDIP